MQGVQRIVMICESSIRQVLRTRRTFWNARRGRVHEGFHAFINPITALLLELEALILDKAIAVACFTVAELDGVDHAVAVEGVISLLAEHMHGVRSYAEKVTLQVVRYGADHLHILGIAFFVYWTEVAVEEKIIGGRTCCNGCHARFSLYLIAVRGRNG